MTLSRDLRDKFGQTLGKEHKATFSVGAARPQLMAGRTGFVVLDPAAKGTYSVFSVNFERLKVELFAVEPGDWPKFAEFMRGAGWRSAAKGKKLPGRRLLNRTIKVAGQPDEMVETRIDLGPALKNGKGQVIAVIQHLDPPPPHAQRVILRSWIQVTDIALDAFVDNTELIGWATSLEDGKPLSGVALNLLGSQSTETTGADGLATIPLQEGKKSKRAVLVARKAGDVTILPEETYWWGSGGSWEKRELTDAIRWYVLDDRQMYRPREKVHIKGWVRRFGAGESGDLGPLDDGTKEIAWSLRDARNNTVRRGNAKLNLLGGFDLAFDLPDTMNLGQARLDLAATGSKLGARSHTHAIQVQEFRRPEFEVKVEASEGPFFVGQSAAATVTASYYAGGGLPDAPVRWQVSTSEGTFVPPNRSDFSFGGWTPWWERGIRYRKSVAETFSGATDAMGKHRVQVDFERANPPRVTTVTAEASVTDVNRQRWTASTTMLVHPSLHYVGVRTARPFVDRGKPIVVEAIVTDLDGKAIAGSRIDVEAVHLKWGYEDGSWQEKEEGLQTCSVDSSEAPVTCEFDTPDGGSYKIRTTVRDRYRRPNQSDLRVWVTGGKLPPKRNVEQEAITLIPDQKEYQPGDTAQIMVQAPFFPGEGLLSVRRAGIVETQRFAMEGPSTTVEVPIRAAHVPSLDVQVDLVGAAERVTDTGETDPRLPKRPAFAKGSLKLSVPPGERTLALTVEPRHKEVEPGGRTFVDVTVKDAKGEPVRGGEVALVVVDEAILALSGYKLADPITAFYRDLGAGARDHHLRANVLLANPEGLLEMAAAQPTPGPSVQQRAIELDGRGGARLETKSLALWRKRGKKALGDMGGEAPQPIRMRADFNPLAVFAPDVPTNASGKASVEVKLPDNLTRYRVMAVAVAGGQKVGSAESSITARLPIMVRPSPPRFLNFGDTFELPVVLQNQTDEDLEIDVAVRAQNLEITDGAGRRVQVPARDRVEVRLPAAAAMPGTATAQLGAVAGKWSDAAKVSFPVWTPATTEAFATYGEIDAGAIRQPIRAPPNVVKEFGGLEVTTSSTALQALTDAVLYLISYPYECAEQVSSRVLAIAALKDVLAAFEAEGLPEEKELFASVERDINKLKSLQNPDGGFGLWRRAGKSWPYVSVHVAHALWRAKAKGFDVPEEMMGSAARYLRDIERHVQGWPSEYARRITIAYATYVLDLMGERHPDKARKIVREKGLDGLSLEAIGWIIPVLSGDATQTAAIRKYLKNRVTETATAANFVTRYHDGDYLTMRSSRRADAVILEAMIATQPRHDLIPKLVRGLLAHRKRGRWGNTQENVFVLLALDRYFHTFEGKTPDFVARAWLGDRFAGEHAFKGRSTDRHRIDIPMQLIEGDQELVLQKAGAGRLYYRVGMRYAPTSLKLEPADHGFVVERVYEPIDEPSDVQRDAEGTWRVKAGARVRVRLRMVAPSRRYHVALVDPLPAGLEPLNPALKVTGDIPRDAGETKSRWWWWHRSWFEHQNMRDERVEAFASLVWDGVHSYSYVTRATTPGTFVVPPSKAEEMYNPETFGRTGTDRLVVE
ncbi:alpha-2-macroglobulin [Myxococcota bacterium]